MPKILKILVVDDSSVGQATTSRRIEFEGHECITAEDGLNALKILMDEDGNFDLVVSDLFMPKVDDIKLHNKIQEKWPSLPVIL